MSSSGNTDRIEKRIVLRAPRSRVWRALHDAEELGAWFGVVGLKGRLQAGAKVKGDVTHPGYEAWTMEVTVEKVEPERYLSWRWHPNAGPGVDVSGEPTTLVEFRLEEVSGGTELTVIESGFDAIPLPRRQTSFRANEGGWAEQLKNIQRHVSA